MLRARLVVAAIGLPLLALLIALPERPFSAIVALLLAAAAIELFVAAAGARPYALPLAAGVATALIAAWARRVEDDFPLWTLLPLPALALYGLLRPGPGPRRLVGAWWLGVVAFVGVLGAHWLLLRGEPDGRSWVIVLLAVVFATDTGAYVFGRLWGKRPLAPRLSPSKTWEGAIGGYLVGAAVGVALQLALGPTVEEFRFGASTAAENITLEPVGLLAIALTLPIAAQVGDLVVSALKRRIGVKDTSALLPGHGGLLDRMNSLLLAGPLLYWLLQWL